MDDTGIFSSIFLDEGDGVPILPEVLLAYFCGFAHGFAPPKHS
jgi:hypothetical protein